MLWAALTLAFFAFLRASEITYNGPFNPEVHLTSQDIVLHPDRRRQKLDWITDRTTDRITNRIKEKVSKFKIENSKLILLSKLH